MTPSSLTLPCRTLALLAGAALTLLAAPSATAAPDSESVTLVVGGAENAPPSTSVQTPAKTPPSAAMPAVKENPKRTPKPTPSLEIAPDDTKGDIVELPRYVVTDERILPPPESWRYATLPGFEILSNAYDFTTRAFLKDFQQLQAAIGVVWPTLVIHNVDTPTILILCSRGNAFSHFIPDDDSTVFITPTSLFVEDVERGAIVIDFTMQEALAQDDMFVEAAGTLVTSEMGGSADTSMSGMTVSRTVANDPYGQFYRQYARFLMRRANNNIPIPDWLEEGLSQLFTTLDFRKKWIEFGKVEYGFAETDAAPDLSLGEGTFETPSSGVGTGTSYEDPAGGDGGAKAQDVTGDKGSGQFSTADQRARFGHIMSLDAMFNPVPEKLSNSQWRVQWKKQCFAFAHMCLYGLNKKYQKAFINFARKACGGPVDESVFKECFKQSYKQMAARMAGHVDSLAQQSVRFKAKKGTTGLPEPLPVDLREATQAEVGRIKGEVLRLAGHKDASREALIVPYLRKERDPGLLASLGLLESLEHRKDRARKFLEAAAKEKVVRPRAYAELARLRLEEALNAPAGLNGTISAAQTAKVLDPLFTAREQPPSMEDVYFLIGQTWLCSEVTPKEAHLGVLLEGAMRFPRNIGILEHAASLYARHGDKATASTLIKLGIKISPDRQTREKFETLRARLE